MTITALRRAWRQYICRACGLIYDEALGDADSGIAPGTRFEDIPDDWACPLCGVTKADFEPYDAVPIERIAAGRAVIGGSRRDTHPVVIVGGGRAGWQMASALRERDGELPITLVTACAGDVYDKPMLSIAMARKIALPDLVREAAAQAATRLDVRLVPETTAIRIDAGTRSLRTTRGPLRYRHLVLAHGAMPRDVAQLPPELCWRINQLETYRRFRERLVDDAGDAVQRIVVCGAGLVGCELANDLALAGYPVTLLDSTARPLAALLDASASARLLEAWRGLPLRFVGGVRISGVVAVDGSRVKRVDTADGASFHAEHVVAATGLETPSRLARSAGLAWDSGIAVDPLTLRTSVPHIHALGDCISIDGQAHRFIEPIGRQARLIAATLAGATSTPYTSSRPPIRVKTSSLALTVA